MHTASGVPREALPDGRREFVPDVLSVGGLIAGHRGAACIRGIGQGFNVADGSSKKSLK